MRKIPLSIVFKVSLALLIFGCVKCIWAGVGSSRPSAEEPEEPEGFGECRVIERTSPLRESPPSKGYAPMEDILRKLKEEVRLVASDRQIRCVGDFKPVRKLFLGEDLEVEFFTGTLDLFNKHYGLLAQDDALSRKETKTREEVESIFRGTLAHYKSKGLIAPSIDENLLEKLTGGIVLSASQTSEVYQYELREKSLPRATRKWLILASDKDQNRLGRIISFHWEEKDLPSGRATLTD